MSTEPNYSDESFDLDELEVESSDSPVFRFDGEKITDLSSVNIKKYDFTNPIVLSDADFGKIRTKAEQFAARARSTKRSLKLWSFSM